MAAPSFVNAGDGDAQLGDINVPYHATVTAGNLLLMAVVLRNAASDTSVSAPSGWSQTHVAWLDATSANVWVFAKEATGSESGTVLVDNPGTGLMVGRMFQFSGWLDTGTLSDAFEGGSAGFGTDSSIEATSVTTTDIDRLCVALVSVEDDNALDAFTGETGGDWAEPVAEYTTTTGNDAALGIQTATLASAGTISGGSDTMAAADDWCVLTFAIKPAAATKGFPFRATTPRATVRR